MNDQPTVANAAGQHAVEAAEKLCGEGLRGIVVFAVDNDDNANVSMLILDPTLDEATLLSKGYEKTMTSLGHDVTILDTGSQN